MASNDNSIWNPPSGGTNEYLFPARRQPYHRVTTSDGHDLGEYELDHYETYSSHYGVSPQPSISSFVAPSAHSTDPIHPAYRAEHEQPTSQSRFQAWNPWTHVQKWGTQLNHWQRTNKYSGWRLGVLSGLIISTIVLFTNLILLIVGLTKKGGYVDGIATLHEGDADKIGKLSTMYHVLINLLSTLLLTASNYTMQVLCSPRREDLDKAHATGQFLNVGILSTKNVRHIPKRRVILWWTLALSSVPLHLFYNAAIFKVTTGNQVSVNFVSSLDTNQIATLNKTMHNMTNSRWQQTYDPQYVSEYNDLYFIIDQLSFSMEYFVNTNGSMGSNITSLPKSVNISPGSRTLSKTLILTQGDWYVPTWFAARDTTGTFKYDMSNAINATYNLSHTYHISYAFANPVEGTNTTSKVQIGMAFMVVVIVCNAIKALTMLLAFMDANASYLVTQGDALASFLARPDPTTISCCLTPYDKIENRIKLLRFSDGNAKHPSIFEGEIWQRRRRLLDNGVSSLRGHITYGISLLTVVGGIALLSTQGLKSRGWGPASALTFTLINNAFDARGILLTASVANAPQLILSIVYITFNGVWTCVAMAYEWNAWATSRKGLRVTKPQGAQRSTHFLQLPYKFAAPLTITSGVLHWLLSESLFLVRADIRDREGALVAEGSVSACGYSLTSFLALLLVAFCLIGGTGFAVSRKIVQEIPFAAANSLVLSAACHPLEGDTDAHLKEVKWGAVPLVEGVRDENVVGHCCFSSGRVEAPVVGKRYA